MLELRPAAVDVVDCHAPAATCDALAELGEGIRVAADELLFLSAPGTAGELVERIGARADHAIAVDATDGWTPWDLAGDEARTAFTYLSALELPADGAVQGAVANLPAKVVASGDVVRVLVASPLGDEMRRRILARCASLGPVEGRS